MTLLETTLTRLLQITLVGLLWLPSVVSAETDYDVTMRMVADEEALDSSFVQEMQIPASVNDLDEADRLDALDAGELSSEAQALAESLTSEARETRDALRSELPGEGLLEQPVADLPEQDLPEPDLPQPDLPDPELPVGELPDTDLPGTELPGLDLDLRNDSQSTLDKVTGQ